MFRSRGPIPVVSEHVAVDSAASADDEMAVVDSGATMSMVNPVTASRQHCPVTTVDEPYDVSYANGTGGVRSDVAWFGPEPSLVDVDLTGPLVAVNTLLRNGNDVYFSMNKSYVRHVDTGIIYALTQNDDSGLWEIPLKHYKHLLTLSTSTHGDKPSTAMVDVQSHTFLDCFDVYINQDGVKRKRVYPDETKQLKLLIKIHKIMGHAAIDNIHDAIANGLWVNTGLKAEDVRRLWSKYRCIACIMAKTNALPISRPTDPRTIIPGHTISVDPVPITQKGPNGERWIMFFEDVCTGHWLFRLTKTKDVFPTVLDEILSWWEAYGWKVKIVRTDDESVLDSEESRKVMAKHGNVARQSSVPYQHHQNIVERHVQTLVKAIATLLHAALLLKPWMWTYACWWLMNTRNNTPNKLTNGDTPNHIVTKKTVNFANTYNFTFGEMVAVGIKKEHRIWQYDTKRELGVYLGQPDGYVDGHLIYFPYDQSVLVRGDVMSLNLPDEQMAQFYLARWGMTNKQSNYKMMVDIVDHLRLAADGEIDESKDVPIPEEPSRYNIPPRTRMPTRSNPKENVPITSVIVEDVDINEMDVIVENEKFSGVSTDSACHHSRTPAVPIELDFLSTPDDITDYSLDGQYPTEEQISYFMDELPWWKKKSAHAAKVRGASNPTLKQALRSPEEEQWREAIRHEIIVNLLGSGALQPCDLPINALITYITMQLKVKPDKLKARGCLRGDLLPKDLSETYSPTVGVATYSLMQTIAVIDELVEALVDTVAAFLAQDYPDDAPPLYVKLDPILAEIAGLNPHQVYRIRKYLYGIPDAGRAYYKAYSGLLIRNGYIQSKFDPCLFFKVGDGKVTYVWIHVDDTFVAASTHTLIEDFVAVVKSQFDVTVQEPIDTYIGISYQTFPDGSKLMTQPKLLSETAHNYHVVDGPKTVKCPHRYPSSVPPDLNPFNVTAYLSLLGVLLFLLHTRPEIGFDVSWGASKSHAPTNDDWAALIWVLQYLWNTKEKGVMIQAQSPGCPLRMHIMCDASYLLYPDSKAQTGYAMSLNGIGFICSKSQKQPLVTTSSTHSEMRSLFVAVCMYIFLAHICEEIGRPLVEPALVFEDNMAVVTLLTREKSLPQASKHFIMLVNWAREQIAEGRISIHHLATTLMIPDILTKSVFGRDFQYKAQQLRGVNPGEEVLLPVETSSSKSSSSSSD